MSKDERLDVVLQPGEYAVGDARCRMRTVLGSCVSITLWHPRQRIGAMSHFLLARREGRPGPLDARYGEEAMQLMIQDLQRADVKIAQCEAKVFGGGDMFPDHHPQRPTNRPNVGRSNGDAARRLLQAHGLTLHAGSLYGVGHRQIVFDVATGDVWARQIQPGSGFVPLGGDTP